MITPRIWLSDRTHLTNAIDAPKASTEPVNPSDAHSGLRSGGGGIPHTAAWTSTSAFAPR